MQEYQPSNQAVMSLLRKESFAVLFVAAACLLNAPSASASASYPDQLNNEYQRGDLSCTTCHVGAPGVGTATSPYALTLRGYGLVGGGNTAALQTALDEVRANADDSDKGGVDDVTELGVHFTDVNVASDDDEGKDGGGVPPTTQQPVYGCFAQLGSSAPTGVSSFLLLGGLLLLLRRRRSA